MAEVFISPKSHDRSNCIAELNGSLVTLGGGYLEWGLWITKSNWGNLHRGGH